MKKTLIISIAIIAALCAIIAVAQSRSNDGDKVKVETTPETDTEIIASRVISISQDKFAKEVFDYTASEFKFLGSKHTIVDFNATWCGPCRMLAPILDSLSVENAGNINFYSVDIDENPQLAAALGIQSIPTLLFIPAEGQPRMAVGFFPREALQSAITDIFK